MNRYRSSTPLLSSEMLPLVIIIMIISLLWAIFLV